MTYSCSFSMIYLTMEVSITLERRIIGWAIIRCIGF